MTQKGKNGLQIEIRGTLDSEYERMFPHELEKNLIDIFKEAKQLGYEDVQKQAEWELDLINKESKQYEDEISNIWEHLLEKSDFKPFNNEPYSKWKPEAVSYYKERFREAESSLSRARYAFAIMTFSDEERLDWMEKSAIEWKKTADKYISDEEYDEYHDIPPFAYELSLQMCVAFQNLELGKKILRSLHKNIIKLLDDGEKRWHLDLFKVESEFIDDFENVEEDFKEESIEKLEDITENFHEFKDEERDTTNHGYHDSYREHLQILTKYNPNEEYNIRKKIVDSYTKEAELNDNSALKQRLYTKATKECQTLLDVCPKKRNKIKEEINSLAKKIKEETEEIEFGKIKQREINIDVEEVKEYLNALKEKDDKLFHALLSDSKLIPEHKKIKKRTNNGKGKYPLKFQLPITIQTLQEPILLIDSEEEIFDWRVRRNILAEIKEKELKCKVVFDELESDAEVELIEDIIDLIEQEELNNLKPALKKGFRSIFEEEDYIAGLHILVPYIEEIIRQVLQKSGKADVVVQQSENMYLRAIMLGGLLENEKVGKIIGFDFQQTLKILLTDNDQTNLRNNLLHGRFASEKIREEETKYVAYMVLKLLLILNNIKVEDTSDGKL